jgi:hypothetical protein
MIEKYVLLKLKTSPFAGTTIMGKLIGRDKNITRIQEACVIHYFVSQEAPNSVVLKPSFMVNPIESEGVWEFSDYDITAFRHVDPKEQTFKLYDETMTRFRVEKAGLALPPKA